MTRGLVALGIDLDALELYCGLYGLSPDILDDSAIRLVPGLAAQRFGELCDRLGIKGTAFVVGRDVERGRGVEALRHLAGAGHEIASHSYAHDYALTRRDRAGIEADLARAEATIEAAIGVKPAGFRAPGYTISDVLTDVLAVRGYAYDSSLLASPPYYAAKAAVIGALRLVGRKSQSILGDPRQLFARRAPHVRGVLELPIAVLPWVRLPFYGTSITGLPEVASRAVSKAFSGDRLVVIELHGVDLIDHTDGVPSAIADRQRDLRIPAAKKLARLEAAMRALLATRDGVTHLNAASLVRPLHSK